MRQQQQRSRNRNRGRKSTNPNSRNFESNGPDVKIRGNASHIAEKYNILAQDAQTSGDTVMAENYFQHAEHYLRIIATAQQNSANAEVQNSTQNSTQNSAQRVNENGRNSADLDGPPNKNAKKANVIEIGDRPQPELGKTSVEVVMKEENSPAGELPLETSTAPTGDEERGRVRRNGRRPVTKRSPSDKVIKKADDDTGSNELSGDVLSKDAALLPSSIIGKPVENEGDNSPVVNKE